MNRNGWWNGRAYVDEKEITQKQYETFFGKYQYGISFEMANMLLGKQNENGCGEVVPCDELNYGSITDIKEQVINGNMGGEIQCEGQSLRWNWDNLEVTENGRETSFEELPDFAKEKILHDMLDNGYKNGEWYE